MSLPWRPRFDYGAGPTSLTLAWPMRPPRPVEGSVGGLEWSAADVPSGYVVRARSDLQVPLRFTEAEWPAVRAFLRAVQAGALFTWYPDAALPTSYACYLVSPAPGEDIQPSRGPEAGALYELVVTLRSAGALFDVRYFG